MHINPAEISKIIEQRISSFKISNELKEEGTIISVSDGIISIYGINKVMQGEVINLPENCLAIAMNLRRDYVDAIVIGKYTSLKEGMKVKRTGKLLEVPVGNSLLGRVVNALGMPIDNKGVINYNYLSSIEAISPGIIDRNPVSEPIQTGYKYIDAIIPIGKGQRELIIGDRQTGKSALAIDIIINQKNKNIKCIYVAIGQKASTIVDVVNKLKKYDALDYSIVVVATASESATMQYLAPYSGCTMGEYFRDRGEDALIIYDDLSKQAVAYRQLSLLLRRPPGREAYPGDIFYLHSRLLERASCVNSQYIEKFTKGKIKNKIGSLTALPIIETQEGDISTFIPTNVISITDGQIFLESKMFNAGIRPAINPGISISRIGSAAQTKIMKTLCKNIRSTLAQYNELISFSKFSSDLDSTTKRQLDYGVKLTELLKQKQYTPISIAHQSLIFFALENGYLSDIPINRIKSFEEELISYFNNKELKLIKNIEKNGNFDEVIEDKFKFILNDFKKNQFF